MLAELKCLLPVQPSFISCCFLWFGSYGICFPAWAAWKPALLLSQHVHRQQNREITLLSIPLSWSKEASHFSSTRPSGISHYAFSCREQGHWNAAGNLSLCVKSCVYSLCLDFGLGQGKVGEKEEYVPIASISFLKLGVKHFSPVAISNFSGERLDNFLLIAWEQSPLAYWTCGDYMKYMTEYGLTLI